MKRSRSPSTGVASTAAARRFVSDREGRFQTDKLIAGPMIDARAFFLWRINGVRNLITTGRVISSRPRGVEYEKIPEGHGGRWEQENDFEILGGYFDEL